MAAIEFDCEKGRPCQFKLLSEALTISQQDAWQFWVKENNLGPMHLAIETYEMTEAEKDELVKNLLIIKSVYNDWEDEERKKLGGK